MRDFWKKLTLSFLFLFVVNSSVLPLNDDDLPPHHGTSSDVSPS